MLAIETEGLARRFQGNWAVNGIDLAVPDGAIFGFLGPNGAGKTTTIRMLIDLLRPHKGKIRILGEDLTKNRVKALRNVGVAFEAPAHYEHLTGRENLDITRRLRGLPKTEIDRVLETVELAYVADRHVRKYSLGMRHRLGLAKALLGQPKLLLFDEPTNGLDPIGIREIRQFIQTLPERTGATVFISSHHLAEVEQMATHVAVIHQGSIMFQGTMGELQGMHTPYLDIVCSRMDEAAARLQAAGREVERRGDRLRVTLSSAENANAEAAQVNTDLVGAGFEVQHLAVASWTLEELFMQFVTAPQPALADGTKGGAS
jgi:ABC-2 type transport system ATP-binding protein